LFNLGAGTILGTLTYYFFTANMHFVTVYIWIVLSYFKLSMLTAVMALEISPD
jgi:hypothetical protein